MNKKLLLVLPMLSACGSMAASPVVDPIESKSEVGPLLPTLSAPAPDEECAGLERAAFRARVVLSFADGRVDNVHDVVVAGPPEGSRARCEGWHAAQLQNPLPPELDARWVSIHGCGEGVQPPLPVEFQGSHLLIGTGEAMAGAIFESAAPCVDAVERTVQALGSADACESTKEPLEREAARAEVDSAARVERFLHEERERLAGQQDEACSQERVQAMECEKLKVKTTEACEAKNRTACRDLQSDYDICDVHWQRLHRACETHQQNLKLLKERLRAGYQREQPTPFAWECAPTNTSDT